MFQYQSFGEVVAALRRRAPLLSFLFLVGFSVSLWAASQQDRFYETSGTLRIVEDDSAAPGAPASMPGFGGEAGLSLQAVEQHLMARGTVSDLIEDYRLFPDEDSVTDQVFALRQAVLIEEVHAGPDALGGDPDALRLRITVRLEDAHEAATIANALMATAIEDGRSRTEGADAEALSFLANEAERLSALIDAQEAAIAAFKRANSSALPGGIGPLREQLATFEESLLGLDREIIELEARSEQARGESLQRQVAQLRAQRARIEQRIAEIGADLARAPDVERALSGLERDLAQMQARYTVVTRHRADAEMSSVRQERGAAVRFEIIEAAPVPESAMSRSGLKVALAGGGASLVLAVAVVLLLGALDPSIRTAGQMERRLGITPLAAIPPVRTPQERKRMRFLRAGMVLVFLATVFATIRAFGGAVIETALSWRQAEL